MKKNILMFIVALGISLFAPSVVNAETIKNYNDGTTVYTNSSIGIEHIGNEILKYQWRMNGN